MLAIESDNKKNGLRAEMAKRQSRSHSRSLRTGRVSLLGHYYLLTTATLHREPVFEDLSAGRCVVREMVASDARTLAYVIMPDHVHWLIELQSTSLTRVMQVMKSRSAIAVNRHLCRTGAFWQDGYHDHALRKDEDLCKVVRYMAANPLRAGLVDDIRDYALWDAMWL